MNYLVTGGAGFIGSNIVEELLRRGESVRVLDNFATGRKSNLVEFENHRNFELIDGDFRSFHIARQAVRDMDYVLHQGALPSVPRSVNDPITSNDTNILGTLNILEAAREFKIKRVVCASSSSVYGNSEQLPKIETMAISPLSPYALTKYATERYCQIYHQVYGLETVALRYFNVFGPKQDPNSQYSAVIPLFINAIAEGRQPLIHGDGLQSRDFTYIMNNISANILACTATKAAGEVFNIACGERYTLIDLVNTLNKLLGKNIAPNFSEVRIGDVKHSLADINKAKQLLGYNNDISFEDGLKKTIEYYLS